MTQLTILPHPELCPQGMQIEAKPGKVLCDTLLNAGIALEHACDGVCACSTCHVIIQQGNASLTAATDEEEDQLDKAWGLTPQSRLACQVKIGNEALTIALPKYSLNHAREMD